MPISTSVLNIKPALRGLLAHFTHDMFPRSKHAGFMSHLGPEVTDDPDTSHIHQKVKGHFKTGTYRQCYSMLQLHLCVASQRESGILCRHCFLQPLQIVPKSSELLRTPQAKLTCGYASKPKQHGSISFHLPSVRGRASGGGPPTAKLSGNRAAPEPPPDQPSMALSLGTPILLHSWGIVSLGFQTYHN